MSSWMNMMFQDSMSPIMFYMTFFHEFIMMITILITTMIMYIMMNLMMKKYYTNKIIDQQMIESIWTVMPLLMLIMLAMPSIKILYLTEELKMPNLSFKSIGNQWYWSYEYPQFKKIKFDSFMINMNELNKIQVRLMDVDNRLMLPMQNKIRLLTTSNDVIHSFTVPSLGFKVDSIPGRINQSSFSINTPGIFYGQCSEICGTNHSFMPIVIESISSKNFKKWLFKF